MLEIIQFVVTAAVFVSLCVGYLILIAVPLVVVAAIMLFAAERIFNWLPPQDDERWTPL